MIPLVDLQAQYRSVRLEIDTAVQRVLDSSRFIAGDEVTRFEEAFASYCGVRYAVGVASGTAALHLSLLACGVGPGDEVITSPHTFIATAEAICQVGARPVFADIERDSFNIDPARVRAAITPRTKAILPVHLYGQAADMDPLLELAERHGLSVIEDAAQAHGAAYKGRQVGSLGDAACFSFFPSKPLGAYGDGGMVVTNDLAIAEQVRLLHDHGRHTKYEHSVVGYGERLDAIQAAILSTKLTYLDEWNERRRSVASQYRELLPADGVAMPLEMGDGKHVYHLFVVRVPDRDSTLAKLNKAGIGAGVHYPVPLHLQPALESLGYKDGDFENTEQAAREILSLPIYAEITADQIVRVANALSDSQEQ